MLHSIVTGLMLALCLTAASARAGDERDDSIGEERRTLESSAPDGIELPVLADASAAKSPTADGQADAAAKITTVKSDADQPGTDKPAIDKPIAGAEAATKPGITSDADIEPKNIDVEPKSTAEPKHTAEPRNKAETDALLSAAHNEPEPHGPLALLGARVEPGSAQRLDWYAEAGFSGLNISTPVLVVHGAKPGPRLCLVAAIHGDELNGIEVVRRVMFDLQPAKLAGTVIGIPIVNLQGFQRASRYLADRRDLNRYFPGAPAGSAAARIAHSMFEEIIQKCDLLVDLHTGSFRRTNLPQLRADLRHPEVLALAEQMGAIVVLQSVGAAGSLRRVAVEHGIPAVTLEAGEPMHVQLEAVQQSVDSVSALLHHRGMYPQRGIWARRTEPKYYKSRWVRVHNGGILISNIDLGERVEAGAVLGTITDPITNEEYVIEAPMAGRVIGMALNQVLLPGYAAYHIGFQASATEAAESEAPPDTEARMDNDAGLEPAE